VLVRLWKNVFVVCFNIPSHILPEEPEEKSEKSKSILSVCGPTVDTWDEANAL
jgi:hypothetical protein